jgi:hypothetical protein
MSRRVAVFGLLAIAVMIVAGIVFRAGMLNERRATTPPGATSYVPCASCDARHQRLQKDRPGKE